MVRVEMLAVGKELLIGRTLNTNAHWIGNRLARLGSMLKEVTVIDDDLEEISSSFKDIVSRSPDFLIVVGGLGPTPDDMTLEGVAAGLGVKLGPSRAALGLIREHYVKRGLGKLELTPSRLKMSRLPVGGEPVPNQVGTAPGVRIAAGRVVVFCLPGVPAEMRSIYRRSVEPEIVRKLGRIYRGRATLKIEGVLESSLAPVLGKELKRHPGAYIKSHPRGVREGVSRIELDVVVVGKDRKKVQKEEGTIVREMKEAVTEAGGKVRPKARRS